MTTRQQTEWTGNEGPREDQVWSLTQLYSVDFSKSRIGVKSVFSTNSQSRFASVVDDVSSDHRAKRVTPDGVLVSL